MATVNGLTAERMLALEAATVVDGHLDGSGHLILVKHDGSTIDAGDALVGIPEASTSVSGAVELATSAETITGTDTVRAVTPSGFAAGFSAGFSPAFASAFPSAFSSAYAAVPGDKVQIITAPAESAADTSYPVGASITSVSSGSGWTPNSGQGTVYTIRQNSSSTRTYQMFYANFGGTQTPISWFRTYHTTNGGGGWTSWQRLVTTAYLAGMDATQNLFWGGDTNLYRSAADTLKTDDSLVVGGNLTVSGNLTVTGNLSVSGIGKKIWKVKTVGESVASNTTPQDDDDLFFTPGASTTWAIRLGLIHSIAGSVVDLRVRFAFPTNATLHLVGMGPDVALANATTLSQTVWTAFSGVTSSPTANIDYGSTTPIVGSMVHLVLTTTATSTGDFKLQFSQVSPSGTPITMDPGSHLLAERVA